MFSEISVSYGWHTFRYFQYHDRLTVGANPFFNGWVIAKWLAHRPPLWVGEGVSEIHRSGFETKLQLMNKFARDWYLFYHDAGAWRHVLMSVHFKLFAFRFPCMYSMITNINIALGWQPVSVTLCISGCLFDWRQYVPIDSYDRLLWLCVTLTRAPQLDVVGECSVTSRHLATAHNSGGKPRHQPSVAAPIYKSDQPGRLSYWRRAPIGPRVAANGGGWRQPQYWEIDGSEVESMCGMLLIGSDSAAQRPCWAWWCYWRDVDTWICADAADICPRDIFRWTV